jgi:hypothetical protein
VLSACGWENAQEEEKATLRAKENWEWTKFEATFTLPKDFVLLDLALSYRNGCFTLCRTPDAPLAALQFGGVVNYQAVSFSQTLGDVVIM